MDGLHLFCIKLLDLCSAPDTGEQEMDCELSFAVGCSVLKILRDLYIDFIKEARLQHARSHESEG